MHPIILLYAYKPTGLCQDMTATNPADTLGMSYLIESGPDTVTGNVDKIIASLEQDSNCSPSVDGSHMEGSPECMSADGGDENSTNADSHDDGDAYFMDPGKGGSHGAYFQNHQPPKPQLDPKKEMDMKRELLYQLDRLAKKGISVPRTFTLASSLEEMQAEYDRLKRDRELDKSVNFQRYMMMTAVSGVEMLTGTFAQKYVKLDGWSNHVNENIADFDEIFEELHAKWSSKSKMPPEIRLLLSLGGSAAMFHLTNSMFKKAIPGMDQVLKANPGLMKQMASAMMGTMAGNLRSEEEKDGTGNLMSGLAGFMSSIIGGGDSGNTSSGQTGSRQGPPMQQPPQHAQPSQPAVMKGPRNFDAMMRELNSGSRIETFSTVSDTDISELRDDNRSTSGYSMTSKNGRKVLNI